MILSVFFLLYGNGRRKSLITWQGIVFCFPFGIIYERTKPSLKVIVDAPDYLPNNKRRRITTDWNPMTFFLFIPPERQSQYRIFITQRKSLDCELEFFLLSIEKKFFDNELKEKGKISKSPIESLWFHSKFKLALFCGSEPDLWKKHNNK